LISAGAPSVRTATASAAYSWARLTACDTRRKPVASHLNGARTAMNRNCMTTDTSAALLLARSRLTTVRIIEPRAL